MQTESGAKPTLIMSVPVRNSVCNTILDNEKSENSDSIASISEEQIQRSLNMGQLGMPDAAAAILDNIYGYSQLRNLSTEQLFGKLHESLALETKYQPSLYLPEDSRVSIRFPFFSLSRLCFVHDIHLSKLLLFVKNLQYFAYFINISSEN